jgi:hypothetical protein
MPELPPEKPQPGRVINYGIACGLVGIAAAIWLLCSRAG